MNVLTEQQKEKALKRFVYCQEYYKKYQPEHKNECIQNTNKYILIKLNQTLKSSKNLKTKKRILSKSWKGKVCEVMRKETSFKRTFG